MTEPPLISDQALAKRCPSSDQAGMLAVRLNSLLLLRIRSWRSSMYSLLLLRILAAVYA